MCGWALNRYLSGSFDHAGETGRSKWSTALGRWEQIDF
jgi:hypothetical protein